MLREYAAFLKQHHLGEVAALNLQMLRDLDAPLLRAVAHLPEPELLRMAEDGLYKLLTGFETGTAHEQAAQSLRDWEEDRLPGIPRDRVEPSDLVLVYTAQKEALLSFLPRFAGDAATAVAVVKELELHYGRVQEAAFQVMVRLRKEAAEKLARSEGERQATEAQAQVLAAELRQRELAERRLAAQYEVASGLMRASSQPQALSEVLRAVGKHLGWDWGAVWLVDPRSRSLVCAETWERAALPSPRIVRETRGLSLHEGEGLPGRVWAGGAPIWLHNAAEDGSFLRASAAAESGLAGAVAFPIRARGEVLGVIEVFARAPVEPDAEETRLIEAIGDQIGQYLIRLEAEAALVQTVAELKEKSEALRSLNEELQGQTEELEAQQQELEQLAEELRESNERLEGQIALTKATVDAALDAIVTIDHTGSVIGFNPAASELFGYTPEEALGQPMAELIVPPSLREAHFRGMARYLASGEPHVIGRRLEMPAMRKDGSEFPSELTITRIPLDGEPIFTGYLRDITERKRAEEQHHQLESLRQADVLKDQFLSILSHELRTPINAIMGFGSILEDGLAGPLTDEQRVYLHKMLAGSENLLTLVNDLLDMSRIQAGKFNLDPREMRFQDVVTDVVANLTPLAEQKQLMVMTELDDELPPLYADEQRIAQILTNLLSNAIKFTPDGGNIWVRARRAGDELYCEVEDDGIGIAPESLPKLFKRFSQIDSSSTRKVGGTGLGLSICKALVEAHGGEIGVESVPCEGSRFWFTLPFGAPAPR